jgi:hypothetical protein
MRVLFAGTSRKDHIAKCYEAIRDGLHVQMPYGGFVRYGHGYPGFDSSVADFPSIIEKVCPDADLLMIRCEEWLFPKKDYVFEFPGLRHVKIPIVYIMGDFWNMMAEGESNNRFLDWVDEFGISLVLSYFSRPLDIMAGTRYEDKFVYSPPSFDPSIFFDRRLKKQYDVGFLSNGIVVSHDTPVIPDKRYPERPAIHQRLLEMENISYLHTKRHPGFQNHPKDAEYVGVGFSKKINSCRMFIATGSCGAANAKYVETPASGTLLLATEAAGVDELGLVNGETYVEISENNVTEVVNHYLTHPDEAQRIAHNGYRLAVQRHNCHTRAQEVIMELRERFEKPTTETEAPIEVSSPRLKNYSQRVQEVEGKSQMPTIMVPTDPKIKVVVMSHNQPKSTDVLFEKLSPVFDVSVFDSGSDPDKIPESVTHGYGNLYWTGCWVEAIRSFNQFDVLWVLCGDSVLVNEAEEYKKAITTALPFGCWSPALQGWARPCMDAENCQGRMYDVYNLEGIAMALSQEAMNSVELMKRLKVGWGQDLWMSFKSRQAGFQNVLDGRVCVRHPYGSGYNRFQAFAEMQIGMKMHLGKNWKAELHHESTDFKYNVVKERDMAEVNKVVVRTVNVEHKPPAFGGRPILVTYTSECTLESLKKMYTIASGVRQKNQPSVLVVCVKDGVGEEEMKKIEAHSEKVGVQTVFCPLKSTDALQTIKKSEVAIISAENHEEVRDLLTLYTLAGIPIVLHDFCSFSLPAEAHHGQHVLCYEHESWAINHVASLMNNAKLGTSLVDKLRSGVGNMLLQHFARRMATSGGFFRVEQV